MKNNIKVKRAERSVSQQALADHMQVSRQTINAIENGKYAPSLELGMRLAQFFECSVEAVFQLD